MSEKTKPEDLKLLSREKVTKILEPTENLVFIDILPKAQKKIRFFKDGSDFKAELNNVELNVGGPGLIDSAHCIGLSPNYVGKCPDDLLFPHLNYFCGEQLEKPLRAIIKKDLLLGMTRDRTKSQVVGNERLLRLAEEVLNPDHIVGYHQVSSDIYHSTMAVVTDQSFEPVKEDTIFGGIKIRNSLTGKDPIEVSPYLFRQWCSNGAITAKSLGKYTRKKRDNVDNWFHEIIEGASSQIDREFERITRLTEISVKGHLSETIRAIGYDRRLPNGVVDKIFEQAVAENAETLYDVYNAFTWVASHTPELSPNNAHRIQGIGGYISRNLQICSECHRIVHTKKEN